MKFSKVNQVIYSSAKISIPNMKALAKILLEISCTQDFQILFSKGHNSYSEKGHNLGMKNQRTNGPVNAHLRSAVYTNVIENSLHIGAGEALGPLFFSE